MLPALPPARSAFTDAADNPLGAPVAEEACGPGHACCDPSEPCIGGFCSVVVQ
jgi:hypothetical protein